MLLVYMLHFIFIYDFNTILKCSFIAITIIHIVCFRLNYKIFFIITIMCMQFLIALRGNRRLVARIHALFSRLFV